MILGAQVRHVPAVATAASFQVAVLFHLIVAVLLVVTVAWLASVALSLPERSFVIRPVAVLLGLVLFQVFLGGATWLAKYSWPLGESKLFGAGTNIAGGWTQSLTITAHVVTGSLMFATAVYFYVKLVGLVEGKQKAAVVLQPRLEAVVR